MARATKKTETESLLTNLGIATELMAQSHNVNRKPRLPYGIVVNNKSAGFLIPDDQKPLCNWIGEWNSAECEIQNKKDGIVGNFITGDFAMLCLGRSPEYVVYKRDADVEEAGQVIGLYEDFPIEHFNRELMDVISDYIVIFCNPSNPKQLLHTVPVKIHLKTPVFRISMNQQLDNYYQQVEQCFAELTKNDFSFKSDRWRSLVVFRGNLIADYVNATNGNQGSWCCKVGGYVEPKIDTLKDIMFGINSDEAIANQESRQGVNRFDIYNACSEIPGLMLTGTDEPKQLTATLDNQTNLDNINF